MTQTDKQAHTPEPWDLHRTPKDQLHITGGYPVRSLGIYLGEQQGANAQRIVVAVNACEGISTEALEAGAVAELLEALVLARGWIDQLVDTTKEKHLSEAMGIITAAIAKADGRTAP